MRAIFSSALRRWGFWVVARMSCSVKAENYFRISSRLDGQLESRCTRLAAVRTSPAEWVALLGQRHQPSREWVSQRLLSPAPSTRIYIWEKEKRERRKSHQLGACKMIKLPPPLSVCEALCVEDPRFKCREAQREKFPALHCRKNFTSTKMQQNWKKGKNLF